MRSALLLFAAGTLIVSCKKSNDDNNTPQRTGPNVTAANLSASLSANNTLYYYYVSGNGGALTIPASGTGQTWNYSTVTGVANDTMTLTSAGNSAFPSANFARPMRRAISVGSVMQVFNSTTYYEISNSGWFELGHTLPAMTFNIPGTGTLSYAAQNDVFQPKLPVTPPFPFYLNDSITYSSVIQENSSATATNPLLGLNNAPTSTKYTYSGKIKAIASGKVSLPGFSAPLDAVVVRREQNVVLNFLLNGVTPPVQLLQLLRITDGETTSTTYYDFYNNTGTGYLGYVAVQSNGVVAGYFRKP